MKLIDNATAQVELAWDEPTKSADGSDLNDLAYSSVFYKVGTGPEIVGAKIPATKPQGGGPLSTSLIVPAPEGARTQYSFYVRCTDLSGNRGPATPVFPFEVERVAPAAPANFSVA